MGVTSRKAPPPFDPKAPPKEGDLQVWWVPNPPRDGFQVRVPAVETAAAVLDHLAAYDLVCRPEEGLTRVATRLRHIAKIKEKLLREIVEQYDKYLTELGMHNIEMNAGGLQVFENGEWVDWHDAETQKDIDHFINEERGANPMTIEFAANRLPLWRQHNKV